MTVQKIKHLPKPVDPPPESIDLLGLTMAQYSIIKGGLRFLSRNTGERYVEEEARDLLDHLEQTLFDEVRDL